MGRPRRTAQLLRYPRLLRLPVRFQARRQDGAPCCPSLYGPEEVRWRAGCLSCGKSEQRSFGASSAFHMMSDRDRSISPTLRPAGHTGGWRYAGVQPAMIGRDLKADAYGPDVLWQQGSLLFYDPAVVPSRAAGANGRQVRNRHDGSSPSTTIHRVANPTLATQSSIAGCCCGKRQL